jgi:hypothetical protein
MELEAIVATAEADVLTKYGSGLVSGKRVNQELAQESFAKR